MTDHSARSDQRFRWRLRLMATSLALVALTFVQSPGFIVNDTKYDLAVRPGLFLEKVLHLWDPIGEFGQVQNQAYGYLFPMGPFFLLGHLADVPSWVVQRGWWSLVLVVSFLGIVKLCSVLDIGSPWARILAGLVFALSPRMLTNLGPISIENWPSAIAPWVLVPLVIGARRGSERQAAARSGLAAAFVGGVNAVASAAILPISAIFLLTRSRGPRRARLMRWWPLFMGLATLWWLVPLLVLGRYSPPFLDYIESASGTTSPATIADALRGTTKWVPYISQDYVAGRSLLTDPLPIIESGLLVVLGLVGLTRRDLVERRFLILSLLTGLFLVTMGHLGAVHGLLADTLNTQLDQVLAPLRNTHKWDVLIRLPLVLGLAHLVSVVGTQLVEGRREPRQDQVALRWGISMLAVAAFLGTSTVALSASLASAGSFEKTPTYWTRAAQWLEDHEDGRRTYVAPGSPFGSYTWGVPMDEAIQALADAPWATRSVIPLVPGANIRMMDAIEARLVDGEGSPGLRDYLSRSGVSYILIRNDLRQTDLLPELARVHAAVDSTPGLTRVATFGPAVGGDPRLDKGLRSAAFVNNGWQTYRPAIEIYRVSPRRGESTTASVYQDADLPVLVGDSDTLLDSLEMGLVTDQPVELARDTDVSRTPSQLILTDGSRRQEVQYGRVHDNRSASHAEDEPWQTARPVRDYELETTDATRWLSIPELVGALSVSATSSASNADHFGEIDPSAQPFAAVDGDRDTAWVSGRAVAGRHRLTLTLPGDRSVERVRLTVPEAANARTRAVSVTTQAGTVRTEIAPGDTKTIRTRRGQTSFVAVTATSDLNQPLRISELVVPDVEVARPLALPALPKDWDAPTQIGLSTGAGERSGCVLIDGDRRCAEGAERLSEDGRTIDRLVTMPEAEDYAAVVDARPWGGRALTAAVQQGRPTQIAASSQATHQAYSGAFAAADGDPGTGWVAASGDLDPSLTTSWDSARTLRRIKVTTDRGLVASTPRSAVLDFSDGSSRAVSLVNGSASFRPVTAHAVRVRFVEDDDATSISRDGLVGRELPVGVSELAFNGEPVAGKDLSTTVSDLGCGTGPTLTVNGVERQTSLSASPDQLYRGERLVAVPCGDDTATLDVGENRVTAGHSDLVRPTGVRLRADGELPSAAPVSVSAAYPDAASASVPLPSGSDGGLLLLRVNQNEGWRASAAGKDLEPVTVDGWQQGWRLAGDGTVSLHFAPDTIYRGGLLAGLVGIVIVAVAAVLPGRRRGGRTPAPAVGPWQAGWPVATVATVGVALLLGGWPGAACWAVGWTLGTASGVVGSRRKRAPLVWAFSAVALTAVYAAYAIRPWGAEASWMGQETWPQLVALVALFAAVAGAFDATTSRALRRIAGRSTR